MRTSILRLTRIFAFALALASYWAPWVAHPVVGLSLAEQDLAEFPKFMPQVRAEELFVWREIFYFPLLVLAVGLIGWTLRLSWRSYSAWLLRLFAFALPFASSVFHFYEPSEFRIQLIFALIVLALMLLTPSLRRAPQRLMRGLLCVWFALGATLPTAQYFWMKPAIEEIYNRPTQIGWGVWAGMIGFSLLALLSLRTESN